MKICFPLVIVTLVCAIVGCAPRAGQSDSTKSATETSAATGGACADDGPRFAGTGLCVGRAVNYLDPARLAGNEGLPDGCVWEINETLFGADEALLYQALSCNGKKTELDYRGGAHTATLGVRQSGFFENIPADYEPVRIVSLFEVEDAEARILAFAREAIQNKEESAACAVRARDPDAPSDAFVVDASPAWKARNKIVEGPGPGEGYSVCGPYGYSTESTGFWRITGGYAFFFDFGQDIPDFNANSLTVIRKGADGSWTPAG